MAHLRQLNLLIKKIKVIVIANQSGVARGYFEENDLRLFHKYMNKKLSNINFT